MPTAIDLGEEEWPDIPLPKVDDQAMIFSGKLQFESSLRDIIQPVPQSPQHHAEGDVFVHSRMVRRQLEDAIAHFQQLTADKDSVFGNLDPFLTKADLNILRIGAWMHDVGKASATTFTRQEDEKERTFKFGAEPHKPTDVVRAIGHEEPLHFEPMMKKLGQPWQKMYEKASPQDKEDLWYVIQYHMSLTKAGFSRRMLKQLLDESGKFKNDRRIRLLLIFIMMDKSGRIKLGENPGDPKLPGISDVMKQSAVGYKADIDNKAAIAKQRQKAQTNDPMTFIAGLKARNVDSLTMRNAFKGKFGRDATPDEIQEMTFKEWLILTEEGDKDFNYFKSLVLGRLNLDHQHGLSQSLDAWQPDNMVNLLNGLGEYKNLPQDIRNQVEAKIKSGMGTMGDIIRLMASPPRLQAGNPV